MPTTSVRRPISRLTRSSGFVDRSFGVGCANSVGRDEAFGIWWIEPVTRVPIARGRTLLGFVHP